MQPGPVTASAPRDDDLPSGTLTFLMTDIEGSTRLWEEHPEEMRAALVRHDALFAALVPAHNGSLVKARGEGDAHFAVFTDPLAALQAALALQHALLAEDWPAATPIRVRMGLHSGLAARIDADYYGPTINRCARLKGLGHGGQVLLSAASTALLRDRLPPGVAMRELGSYPLRGLGGLEVVSQVWQPGLPAEFPPLVGAASARHNVPAALTTFIGREVEQGAVLALLRRSRLVTLVGPGGVGKTRLALAVAEDTMDAYPDGVWLVELAAARDGALVAGAALAALGLREEPGRAALATLLDHLRGRRALLVLDNCEHLLAACAELASALLRSCPAVRLLATSRATLEVSGEQRYPLAPLPVPDPAHLPPLEITAAYEVVRLFVTRARARQPGFALNGESAPHVAAICARLDGVPLAIELAAARMSVLGVAGIAARLDDRFRLLTSGPRTALPHHQTLRATLDWSWDLLNEVERALLRRLSIFAAGWTLEAAEAVCTGDEIDGWEVLDLLGALVEKSLVRLEERAEQTRYGMLETVRAYGLEKLAAHGEVPATRNRHLAWCVALAEEAEQALRGSEQAIWLARLASEHDNLRAALGWSSEAAAPMERTALGLQLAGALWLFWWTRGHLREGRDWLEKLLLPGAGAETAHRARALSGAGILATRQGDYEQAARYLSESLALRRALDDRRGIASCLGNLGNLATRQGDYGKAATLFEEVLAIFRDLDERFAIANTLQNLGNVAVYQGDYGRATVLYEEGLALYRARGDKGGMAFLLDNLGFLARRQGDGRRAAALHNEALPIFRELGDSLSMSLTLTNLGNLAGDEGDYARATALFEESLALRRAIGDKKGIAGGIHDLGCVAVRQEDYRRAGVLFQESLALRREIGDKSGAAAALTELGSVARATGDHAAAARLLMEGFTMRRELGDRDGVAASLEEMATLAVARGEVPEAARLFGAAAALAAAIGVALAPRDAAARERVYADLRVALGDDAFTAAWSAGQSMSLDEAARCACLPEHDVAAPFAQPAQEGV